MASDKQSELKELKMEILGLVMSNPNQMDMNALIKDFRTTIGSSIPVGKFGYKSILTFIREECTDILRLSGEPYNPTLTPYVPAELKHVNDLIYKQKSTKVRNAPRRGPGVLHPNNFAPTKSNCESPKRDIKPLLSTKVNKPCDTNNIGSKNMSSYYKNIKPETAVINDSSKYSPLNNRSNATMANKRSSPAVTNNRSNPAVANNRSSPAVSNNRSSPAVWNNRSSPAVVNNRSSTAVSNNKSSTAVSNNKSNGAVLNKNDSKTNCASPTSSTSSGSTAIHQPVDTKPCEAALSKNHRINPRLIENLKALMGDHPEGLWCRDLLSAYYKKYLLGLQLERLGYASTASLCKDLPTVFKITRPKKQGDWRLFSPETDVPFQYRDGAEDEQPKCSKTENSKAETNIDDIVFGSLALPGVKTDISLYPEDCACYGEAIHTPLQLPKTFELVISEVKNPSHFWFLVMSKSANEALRTVMNEMTQFYNKDPKAEQYRMVRAAARTGQLCAVPYNGGRFHRAVVIKNISLEIVKVYYIDYGTVGEVNFSDVYMLLNRFCDLAIQGHRGRLEGVLPISGDWTSNSVDRFMEMIREKHLQAEVLSRCAEENCVTLKLIDQFEEIDIASVLISEGLAKKDDGSVKSHFMSFDMLEDGIEARVGVSQHISDPKSYDLKESDDIAIKKELVEIIDKIDDGESRHVFQPLENTKHVESMNNGFTNQMQPIKNPIGPQYLMPMQYQQNLARPPPGLVPMQMIFRPLPPNLGHLHPIMTPFHPPPQPPSHIPFYGNNMNYPVSFNQLYPTTPPQHPTTQPYNNINRWPVQIRPPHQPVPAFIPPPQHPTSPLKFGPVVTPNNTIRMKRPSSVCSTNSFSSEEVGKMTNISVDELNNLKNNIDRELKNKSLDKPFKSTSEEDTLDTSLIEGDCLEIVSSDEFEYEDDDKPHVSINIDEYQMTLSIITAAFGEVLEIWNVKHKLYVILQQSVKVFVKEELNFMSGFSEKTSTVPICTLLQDEDDVVGELSRKIQDSGSSGMQEGETLTIINKKNIDFNQPYVVLVSLERLVEVLCFEPNCMKYDIQDIMMYMYELYHKFVTPDNDGQHSDTESE